MSSGSDDIDPDDFPEVDHVKYGPFDTHYECGFVYGGIDEECGDEATSIMVWDEEDDDGRKMAMIRCEEHEFPWVTRQRKAEDRGHPAYCETCKFVHQAIINSENEPDGWAELDLEDGGSDVFCICEDCAEEIGVELEPLDEYDMPYDRTWAVQ